MHFQCLVAALGRYQKRSPEILARDHALPSSAVVASQLSFRSRRSISKSTLCGSKIPLGGTKFEPRSPLKRPEAPKSAQERPKSAQDGLKSAQDDPKCAQVGRKLAPRALKLVPGPSKLATRASKLATRASQEIPKQPFLASSSILTLRPLNLSKHIDL